MRMLRVQEWNVVKTHGNKFQAGFPDLYCFHHMYGERWVEVKTEKISYTKYQLYYFPLIRKVWVLRDTTDSEYKKLFKKQNYHMVIEHNTEPTAKEHIVQTHREGKVQMRVTEELEAKGYTVMPTYGNNIQRGLPDLYVIKGMHCQWLELKRRKSFTRAQRNNFPRMAACGIGIWILWIEEDDSYDLDVLKEEPNLGEYL